MRFRSDFVTNSSSSNFVVAMSSDELSQQQKDALIDYILKRFMGQKADDEEIASLREDYDNRYSEDKLEALNKAVDVGKIIRSGYVVFEEGEYHLADVYQDVWNILEQNADEGDFVQIDTRLDY